MDALERTIQKAIEIRKEEIINEVAKESANTIEQRIRKEVGQLAASVVSRLSYERCGTDLLIRVQFENKGK